MGWWRRAPCVHSARLHATKRKPNATRVCGHLDGSMRRGKDARGSSALLDESVGRLASCPLLLVHLAREHGLLHFRCDELATVRSDEGHPTHAATSHAAHAAHAATPHSLDPRRVVALAAVGVVAAILVP
jgi:hypothetical protein